MTKNKTELETMQLLPNSSENSYGWVIWMKARTANDLEFNKYVYLNIWRQWLPEEYLRTIF